ncbi:MAG: DUF6569 family protein [Bacillota bacterium]|nr:DUF6569 family protein [Bacillota bacterium]
MTITISNLTSQLKVGEPQQSGALTIYPLFETSQYDESKHTESIRYLLLTEALDKNNFVIGEISESGDVNTVIITNMTGMPVLILDGEEIMGAKQNRMINATILVSADKTTEIPVSCVERGRWRYYSSNQFAKSDTFGYSSLRRQKSEQVHFSLQAQRGFSADQGAIWAEIDRKHARMGTNSPTSALHDSYEHYSDELNKMIESLKLQPDQTGIMVYINNRFTCLDLFDQKGTLSKLWPRLLKSYAVEALNMSTRLRKTPKPEPLKVIETIDQSEYLNYPSVGVGQDIRLTGSGIVGAGLLVDEQIVHLSVFPREENGTATGDINTPRRRRRNIY